MVDSWTLDYCLSKLFNKPYFFCNNCVTITRMPHHFKLHYVLTIFDLCLIVVQPRYGSLWLVSNFKVGTFDATHEPSGCILRKADNDIMFNTAETHKRSKQRPLLCFDGIPKHPTRITRMTPSQQGDAMERYPKEFATSKPLRQRSSEIGNLSVAKDCKNGSFHIRHPNRCKIAAAAFGKKYIGIMKSFGEPHGCLHRKVDQDIMFNRLRTNSTSSDREFVCNSQADPDVKSRDPLSKSEAAQLKIYCFGWTVRSEREERILPYARALFETCDGHAFFTDLHSPGGEQSDFVRVELPATQQNRSDKFWLLLKNMVGLLPAWDYLLKNNITESFDWVVNLELDHFFFASVLRQTISEHMNLMTLDRLPGEDPWDDAVMMVFGHFCCEFCGVFSGVFKAA